MKQVTLERIVVYIRGTFWLSVTAFIAYNSYLLYMQA